MNRLKTILKNLLTISLLCGIFYFVFTHEQFNFQDLFALNPLMAGLLGLSIPLIWWINAKKLQTLIQHKKQHLTHQDALCVSAAAALFNYLPLQGGILARAGYLKKRIGFSMTQFISLIAGTYVILIAVQGFTGLVLCLGHLHKPYFGFLLGIYLCAVGGVFLALFAPVKIFLKHPRLTMMHDSFLDIFKDKKCLTTLIALDVLLLVLEALRHQLAFKLAGLSLGFQPALMFSTATILSVLLNITPSGIGIREGTVALIARFYEIPYNQALFAAGMDRLITLLVVLPLGGLAAFKIMSQKSAH